MNKKTVKVKAWANVHKPPKPKEWINDFQTHPCYDGESFALDIFETKKEAEKNLEKHLITVPCEITYTIPKK